MTTQQMRLRKNELFIDNNTENAKAKNHSDKYNKYERQKQKHKIVYIACYILLLIVVLYNCQNINKIKSVPIIYVSYDSQNDTESPLSDDIPILDELSQLTLNQTTETETAENIKRFDVVYLWINSSDIKYQSTKKKLMQQNKRFLDASWSMNNDNGELLLSLRSLHKYCSSWVNNIYILTSFEQSPFWLDLENEKIQIINGDKLINHVMNYSEDTYNLNNHAIYHAITQIPSLTEIFIQMDDDFVFFEESIAEDFYNYETHSEYLYLKKINRVCSLPEGHRWYSHQLPTQCELLRKLNPDFVLKWATHIPRIWNKTTIGEMHTMFESEIRNTLSHPLRDISDIDMTSFYPWFAHYNNDRDIIWKNNECEIPNINIKPDIIDNLTKYINENSNCDRHVVVFNDNTQNINLQTWFSYEYYIREVNPIFFYIIKKGLGLLSSSPFENKLFAQSQISIMGHRGIGFNLMGEANIAENTIESMVKLHKLGIKYMEIDIGITNDNVIIVHHLHNTLMEGCKLSKHSNDANIKHKNYTHIQNDWYYNISNTIYHIPTLKDFLLFAKNVLNEELYIQIELKQFTNYNLAKQCLSNANDIKCVQYMSEDHSNDRLLYHLNELLNGENELYDPNKIIISSFEGLRILKWKRIPNNKYQNTALILFEPAFTPVFIDNILSKKIEWEFNHLSIFVGSPKITKEKIQYLKTYNITVQIGMPGGGWCVHEIKRPYKGDESKDLMYAIQLKPDIITTNQPVLAKALLLS